jgi:hypothetical protein
MFIINWLRLPLNGSNFVQDRKSCLVLQLATASKIPGEMRYGAAVMNCRFSAGVIPVAIRPGIVLN